MMAKPRAEAGSGSALRKIGPHKDQCRCKTLKQTTKKKTDLVVFHPLL